MKTDIIVLDETFDASIEDVLAVISDYLDRLVGLKPDASLRVSTPEQDDKTIWHGEILEVKEWGKDDNFYGYIEIIPVYVNAVSPMQVKLYCSQPEYNIYWGWLSNTFYSRLKKSDGSPGASNEPWNLIPDEGYHRKLVELWHANYSAREIGERLNLSPSTIYEKTVNLRKKYGEIIVPYKYPAKRGRKNP